MNTTTQEPSRYVALTAGSAEELEQIVNRALAEGATLVGGVSVSSRPGYYYNYVQAVVWPSTQEPRP